MKIKKVESTSGRSCHHHAGRASKTLCDSTVSNPHGAGANKPSPNLKLMHDRGCKAVRGRFKVSSTGLREREQLFPDPFVLARTSRQNGKGRRRTGGTFVMLLLLTRVERIFHNLTKASMGAKDQFAASASIVLRKLTRNSGCLCSERSSPPFITQPRLLR